MAHAKRREITVQGRTMYQYYCGNCDEWHFPRQPDKPNFPDHCKECYTKLHYPDE